MIEHKKREYKVKVRLKCLTSDFRGERVAVITKSDITDMLASINRSHPANTVFIAWLEEMAKELKRS